MKLHRGLYVLLVSLGTPSLLVLPAGTQPSTGTIAQLEQIGSAFDFNSPGDFYAQITSDGTTQTTFDDRFDFGIGGLLVPIGNRLQPAPWVVTEDAPGGPETVPAKTKLSLQGEKAHEYLQKNPDGQSLMQAVTAARFGLKKQQRAPSGEDGSGYLGVSHEQDLNAWFGTDGVTVTPTMPEKEQAWRLGMQLKAYGYGKHLVSAPPIVAQKVKDNRIEYARTNDRLRHSNSKLNKQSPSYEPSAAIHTPQLVECTKSVGRHRAGLPQ
jgi:hypothetical protein